MRIVLIALLAMLLVAPAHARGQKHSGAQQQPNSEEQKKARQQQEKDYKSALSRIPNQKPADPWGKIR
jgi:hypothetical protein